MSTDPIGTVTSYGYDNNYRQTIRVDAFGISGLQRRTTTAYDAVGNTLSSIKSDQAPLPVTVTMR